MVYDIKIVVSKYKESESKLSWLDQLSSFDYSEKPKEIVKKIYDKSKNADIPNIGREAHTYIHHILNHYEEIKENPEGIIFFTQADPWDHIYDTYKEYFVTHKKFIYNINPRSKTFKIDFISACCEEAEKEGISKSIANSHLDIVPPKFQPKFTFRILEWPLGTKLTPNLQNECFGKWFEKCVHHPFQHNMTWFLGGIFAVRNDIILSRPRSFYESLILEFRDNSPNPEVAHFFERSWFYVFQKPKHNNKRL